MRLIFIFGILFSFCLILLSAFLVRKRTLNQKEFIIWIMISLFILGVSVLPGVLGLFSRLLGLEYTFVTFSVIGISALLLLSLYMYQKLSKTIKILIKLSQKLAFLDFELKEMKKKSKK